jgi:hypothetical protein
MGLFGRLFGRVEKASWAAEAGRSLVQAPQRGLGSRPSMDITPWSATRLNAIFSDLSRTPTAALVLESRRARHCLSQFWLGAPVDQLEGLYRSAIGQSFRALLAGPLPAQPLDPAEINWRDGIARRLMENFDRPETTNLLLAVMPYFDRGKMRVANPLQQVPGWLLGDYAALFDPMLQQRLQQPVGLLGPAGSAGVGMAYPPQQLVGQPRAMQQPGQFQQPAQSQQPFPSQQLAPAQQVSPLPVMAARRGNEALAMIQNQDFLGRMNGLLNLYGIDRSDREVQRELIGLRRQLGQIWLDVNPAQIQALYQSSFGQLYRSFLVSGFSREALIPEDQQLRSQLGQVVSNMTQPRALNALMAALLFYPPGKIQFGGGEQFIPPWLMQDLNSLNAQGQS